MSSSLDLYVYAIAKPRTDGRFYLSWAMKEIVDHPSQFEHSIVRAAFADLARDGAEFPGGVELSFLADVPGTGSGLGSSAATAAACLLALDALAERFDGIHGRQALAERSIAVQPGTVRGKQDEYATVYGGLNAMRFTYEIDRIQCSDGYYYGEPGVDLSPLGEEDTGAAAWLQERFALFRPPEGAARSAADVLTTYDNDRDTIFRGRCIDLCKYFLDAVLARSVESVMHAIQAHDTEKFLSFGGYNSDKLQRARDQIASWGGRVKLCGAGGTGHLLVGFEPERRAEVVAAAEKAWGKELKFRFGNQGAAVVYREAECNQLEKTSRT